MFKVSVLAAGTLMLVSRWFSCQLFSSASKMSEQKVTDGTIHSLSGLLRQKLDDEGLKVILLVLSVTHLALRPQTELTDLCSLLLLQCRCRTWVCRQLLYLRT